jgi:hypothetical protein
MGQLASSGPAWQLSRCSGSVTLTHLVGLGCTRYFEPSAAQVNRLRTHDNQVCNKTINDHPHQDNPYNLDVYCTHKEHIQLCTAHVVKAFPPLKSLF